MRFGNGAWTMMTGVAPTYLTRVDGLRNTDKEVVFNVSSRAEKERWSTLQGHMFTVTITSPGAGMFRVCVVHHKGRKPRGPSFALCADLRPIEVTERSSDVSITSGDIRLIVGKEPWSLAFVDARTGETITESPFKASGMMEVTGAGPYMREQLTLRPGEVVYGLGERFQALARNGQSVDIWNDDCGTCSDKGYKDVPFFMTSRGYGVFVNTPARVSFEIGTEQVMRAQFGVPGEDLDYFLIRGDGGKQVLDRLGALTGRPAMPPAWSFGLWLTTSFVTQYDERTVNEFVGGMAERRIPLHVFHFDCFWMKAHHWVDFEWDGDVFPDPAGMLRRLKERGLHVCVWINSYVGERSHLFDEGAERGYLLQRPNGDVYQRPKWQAGMGIVDFTNPDAVRWYKDKLRALLRMGVDAFKTDFGEEIPTDVKYFDGSDPEKMHNFYTYLYNKAVFEVLLEERGVGEALVFARSATATCQQFPVHWGGDSYGTFESMAESLRGGLSLAMSGFGFWSHDIGGFESTAPAGVYKRWVAFGLFSSHSRLHGNASYRVPWLYDQEAVDVVRRFTEIKCTLMPYIMRAAVQAHERSTPVLRAMILEFGDDPTCRALDRQYMFGDALLVAPVFHDTRAEYYLPEGEWTHLLTGELRAGGRWFFDELDYFGLPVWIRPNGLVAVGTSTTQVDYDYAAGVRLVCGKLDGATALAVEIHDRRGQQVLRFELTQNGRRVFVSSSDGRSDFRIHLPWANTAVELEGGTVATPAADRNGAAAVGGLEIAATSARVAFVWA